MTLDYGYHHPRAPSRDHRLPRVRGGTQDPRNRIICCRGCNEDKGHLDEVEYRAVRAGLASRWDRVAVRTIGQLPWHGEAARERLMALHGIE